jgi:ABC-type transporter Mla subunit MlaD
MPKAELAERVSILEARMENLSEAVQRAERKAETSMARQDFLAENLTEVRTTVTHIKRTQQHHGKVLEDHGRMLEDHGRMLEDHGNMLRQILAKLDRS